MLKKLQVGLILLGACGGDPEVYDFGFEVLDVNAQCWRYTTDSRTGYNYDDYVENLRNCNVDAGIAYDTYRTTYDTCEQWPSCRGGFAFTDPVFHGDIDEPLEGGQMCVRSQFPNCP